MRRALASTLLAGLLAVAACGETTSVLPPVQRVSMTLTDSSGAFGVALLERLLAEKDADNVFISPLSATIVLSMAASAAQGDTRAAILKVLGVDPTANADEQARQTIERLAQSDSNAQLELAQAVWAQDGLKLNPAYVERLKTDYKAELANLDFQSPSAPDTVNRWVDAKTHHKITSLVDRFDRTTVGILVNATYFHSLWATEFKPMTSPVDFHQFGGSTKPVTMMQRSEDVIELKAQDYSAELLPYKGGRFSAVLILPAKVLSPSDFATFLNVSLWNQTIEAFHGSAGATLSDKCRPSSGAATVSCDGTLQMPKFKLDYKKDLTDTLGVMGMPLPGATLPEFCADCYLSKVIQKTYLEVDEKGTTAAAVTGGIVDASAPIPTVVDRPFAFAIVDNATDAPIFLGVIGTLG